MGKTTPPNYSKGTSGQNSLGDKSPTPSHPQSANDVPAGSHTGFGHTSHPANRVPNVRELPIPSGPKNSEGGSTKPPNL